jgi:hypothetical protein
MFSNECYQIGGEYDEKNQCKDRPLRYTAHNEAEGRVLTVAAHMLHAACKERLESRQCLDVDLIRSHGATLV